MRSKVFLILGAIAVIAIGIAGCGGSSSDPGSTEGTSGSAPLTKSEFVALVNESCAQVPPTYEKYVKQLEKGGKTPTIAEVNLKAAVPPLYIAIEKMEALNSPAGEEQNLEKVISALESAAKGLEAEPKSELSGPKSPFAEFQKVTTEYGFKSCTGL